MTKRVAIIVGTLLLITAGFVFGVALRNNEQRQVEIRIGWESYPTPPCSTTVKKLCVVSLSLIAFRKQDGLAIMVADHIAPTATGYTTLLPEGTYDIWVVATGYDSEGTFSTSNPAKTTIDTQKPQQPPSEPQQPASEESERLVRT